MLGSNQRIMLVNDHPGEAFAVWQSLTDSGHATVQIDVVPDLAQTLAHLAAGPVDAIVLDLNLPDSQGLDTLRRVRAAAGPVPVIVLTHGVDTALREQALAEGAEEVYDKHDVNSGLVSHSVLYVVERNRARLQHARLQLLMDTLPEAIVIADAAGAVRFANPAALALFGHPDAQQMGEHIDFMAPLDQALEVQVCQGAHNLRCEVRLAAIEWDGLEARLASVKPLGPDPRAEPRAGHSADAQRRPATNHERVESAARLRQQVLSTLSLQISSQMQAVSGLHDEWEDAGPGPLHSCYLAKSSHQLPQVLPALHDTLAGIAA